MQVIFTFLPVFLGSRAKSSMNARNITTKIPRSYFHSLEWAFFPAFAFDVSWTAVAMLGVNTKGTKIDYMGALTQCEPILTQKLHSSRVNFAPPRCEFFPNSTLWWQEHMRNSTPNADLHSSRTRWPALVATLDLVPIQQRRYDETIIIKKYWN